MTPNLRFNKAITKRLLKSQVPKDMQVSKLSMDWGLENGDKIYGSICKGLFKSHNFVIQKQGEFYRILYVDGGHINVYIIDNMEEYINLIGISELISSDKEMAISILNTSKILPSSGIIYIEDETLFVYDHKDY